MRANQMDDFENSQRSNMQRSGGKWYIKEFGNVWRTNVRLHKEALDPAVACQ